MLAFYNNFLSKTIDTVVDHKENKCILLIKKCGTQSLLDLTLAEPARFSKQVFCTEAFPFETVEVFVRDPVKRFITGLNTQIALYGLDLKFLDNMINTEQIIHFFDAHTCPQFWFLLKFGINAKIKFVIRTVSDLSKVLPTIKKLNQNQNQQSLPFHISPAAYDRITFFLTEDIILYNNFLNQTVMLDDIIKRIKHETNFVNNVRQYENEVNYLFAKY